MDWSTLVSIPVAGATAAATTILADSIGLRRDRARIRMELAWQMYSQKWNAPNEAHRAAPEFTTDPKMLLASVGKLTNWAETMVEPWLSIEASRKLSEMRRVVDDWQSISVYMLMSDPRADIAVPQGEINELR